MDDLNKTQNSNLISVVSVAGAPYKKSCLFDNIPITNNNIVYVKKHKLRLLLSNLDNICVCLGAKLIDTRNHDEIKNAEFLSFHVFCDVPDVDIFELTKRVQVCNNIY